jgi:uncharacterized membrane protein
MVGLGAVGGKSTAARISDDGSTIIGQTGANAAGGSGDDFSYRWTSGSGMTLLPAEFGLHARGINGDGSVIVGAFNWWSAAGGVQPPMPPIDRLYEVSSDGSVFTGTDTSTQNTGGARGYAWSQQDGPISLNPTPEGGSFTDPQSISADGKVIIGIGGGEIRWTKETGATRLPSLPGGAEPLNANGMSADGSVIVGRASGGTDPGAYIWDAVHGSRNLKQVLIEEYGLAASVAGWDMRQAFAVSADGRTIVGGSAIAAGLRTTVDGISVLSDVNPQGQQEAWIAFLGTPVPEPATLLLSMLTLLMACTRRVRTPPFGTLS